ncbi:hypothetical protein DHEL01_v212904 [Diaporthe helianthi]|uniref:Cas1p-like protein n=1 Tax=Diaporthe helianthi TaxID=158607 RepID=A0A2P5HEN2_DIAHE|nr:hypothetical protein DHEL01_v212904 [Diaporthe helianthi]
MFFRNLFTALVGVSIVTAAPASVDRTATPMGRGLRYRARSQQKRDIIIQQTVIEPQVTVINNNLDTIAALALTAEQQFAALVQSQLALVSTVETIKNNIRVNHFKNRWTDVNTVIVAVTNVIDQRDPNNINTRYMVNQLVADNGAPDKEILVMLNSSEPLVIGPAPTPAALNVPGVAGVGNASQPANAAPQVAPLDPNAPFGQLNGSVLLPFGSQPPQAPSNAQVFSDPAAIILPNQGLFVGDTNLIQQDCQLLAAGSLFNLQAQLLANQQAIAQAQLAGLVLGTAPPPTIVVNVNNGQQGQQGQQQSQDQAKQQQDEQQQAVERAKQQAQQQQQQQQGQQAQGQAQPPADQAQ